MDIAFQTMIRDFVLPGMVNTAALNHQKKAIRIIVQDAQGGYGHLRKMWQITW